jgi:transposase
MARGLHVADHLSAEELKGRYLAASDPVERTHFQVVHLAHLGWRSVQIAEASGYSVIWVRKLVRRYNEGGPEALEDQRQHNPGQPRLLSGEQETELDRVLREESPPEGGLWSGPKVARWIGRQIGREVDDARGWEVLVRLGYRMRRPRRRHVDADPEAQESFQGGSAGAAPL